MKSWAKYTIVAVIVVSIIGAGFYANQLLSVSTPTQKTLVVGSTDKYTNMDPAVFWAVDSVGATPILEPLYRYALNSSDLEPCLAVSYGIIDAKTYEYVLREGVKFHDGTPFNASCVKWEIDRAKALGKGLSYAFSTILESVEVVDNYRVRFHLATAFSGFPNLLAMPSMGYIPSPSAAAKYGDDFSFKMIGTGPYKLQSWVLDREIIYVRNEEYWGKDYWPVNQQRPDKIVLKIFADSTTLKLALEKGDIDIAFRNIAHEDVPSLETNADVQEMQAQWVGYPMFIAFTLSHPYVNNKYLRKAIAYAIDYDRIVHVALGDFAKRIYSFIDPSWESYEPAWDIYSYNVTRALEYITIARQKAEQAGQWSPNETISISLWCDPSHYGPEIPNVAVIIQDNLKAIGIKAEIRVVDWDTLITMRGKSELQSHIYAWTPLYNDPYYQMFGICHQKGGGASKWKYTNATYDLIVNPTNVERTSELVDLAVKETNSTKRAEYYKEAQRLFADDAQLIIAWTRLEYLYLRKDIKGLVLGPVLTSIGYAWGATYKDGW